MRRTSLEYRKEVESFFEFATSNIEGSTLIASVVPILVYLSFQLSCDDDDYNTNLFFPCLLL